MQGDSGQSIHNPTELHHVTTWVSGTSPFRGAVREQSETAFLVSRRSFRRFCHLSATARLMNCHRQAHSGWFLPHAAPPGKQHHCRAGKGFGDKVGFCARQPFMVVRLDSMRPCCARVASSLGTDKFLAGISEVARQKGSASLDGGGPPR